MNTLKGKVAVVTGASKGIGAAIAKAFAEEGAAVVVNYASSREGADRVVAEIIKKDGRAIAVQGDVSKEEDVKRLFAETKKAFGAADVLVNNAGVFAFQPIAEITAKEYRREFDTNVLGTILTIQEAVKHFGEKGGSVINVSSAGSTNPPVGSTVYMATKGAVDVVTMALAKELAPRKIRVNTLAPGATLTEGAKELGIEDADFGKAIIAATPLGRIGQPEDIANAAVFLASENSSWLTGERIVAAGGWR